MLSVVERYHLLRPYRPVRSQVTATEATLLAPTPAEPADANTPPVLPPTSTSHGGVAADPPSSTPIVPGLPSNISDVIPPAPAAPSTGQVPPLHAPPQSLHHSCQAQSDDSPKKALGVQSYFHYDRFTGGPFDSIKDSIQMYEACSVQLQLNESQQATFFVNVFNGNARRFLRTFALGSRTSRSRPS